MIFKLGIITQQLGLTYLSFQKEALHPQVVNQQQSLFNLIPRSQTD